MTTGRAELGRCFVIQPFDGGAFDKRYRDTFVPAIADAGLEAYRVDNDPSVSVPIEDIETGIRESSACLADISTDNPNVWFEVGAAIAHGKVLILVCSSERGERFPFDVQHRSVIRYKTESASDFVELRKQIAERLKAQMERSAGLQSLSALSPQQETEGLSPHEVATLVTVSGSEFGPEHTLEIRQIHRDMAGAGFTSLAANLSLEALRRKGLVEPKDIYTETGDPWGTGYKATEKGLNWLLTNQHKLGLRTGKVKPDDDIPF